MPVPPPRRTLVLGIASATAVGLALACVSAPPAQAVDTASPVIVNEVYGGGGNSGATYTNDFVELYNPTSAPVDLSGWSIWYASSTGAFVNSATQRTSLTGTIPAGGYFLVGEAAGSGGSTALPSPDVTGGIAMSATAGKVALTTTATVPTGSTAANVADFVGYGTAANDAAGGDGNEAPGLSNTTSTQRIGTPPQNTGNNKADFGTPAAPSPQGSGGTTTPPDPTPQPGTATIQDVQGSGFVSPLATTRVTNVPGIVTARKSNGYWFQQPTRDPAKPSSSSGLFVFTSSAPTVAVGDSVLVTGTVTEYTPATGALSVTELTAPTTTVVSSGNPLPAALVLGPSTVPSVYAATPASGGDLNTITTVDPAASVQEFYEAHEGEVAAVNDVRTVSATTDFNEVFVTVKPGEQATPRGGTYLPSYAAQPTGRIKVEPVATTLPAYNVGDVIAGTTAGPIDSDQFGGYLIAATQVGSRTDNNLQPTVATAQASDQLAVATYNVENLSPADPQSKFDRLAAGIVTNLNRPDVVTLEEIQDNNGPTNDAVVDATQTLQQLSDAVVAAGGPRYAVTEINPVDDQDGGQPGGNIRVAFFYNPDRVSFTPRAAGGNPSTTPVTVSTGSDGTATLSSNPGRIDPQNTAAFSSSRKPLAAEFGFQGKKVIVVANHFNSKGGDQSADGRYQPPTRSSEVQRTQQATVLNQFVKNVVAADPDANLVLAGDFNDYQFSAPITTLTDNGATLTDLINTLPENQRYTYVFNGVSQVLDHIFVTNNLAGASTQYEVVHLNAEFADQASDHDPQVVRIKPVAKNPNTTIQLLDINDFHGRIDGNTVKWAGTIEQQRALVGDANSVLLSAGDNIGASLFASASQQDNPTIDVLNAIGLQASAVGNHEFDQGYSDLVNRVIPRAQFSYLGANVYVKGTQDPALPQYAIVNVGGLRVGVIGAVTQETSTLVSPGGIANLDFGDPVTAVNRVADQLTDGDASNGEADVLVAEYHEGAPDSETDSNTYAAEVAKSPVFAHIANDTTAKVGAIFTGHTHRTYTFDAPVPGDATGKTRPIVQTGEYGSNIGNVTLTVDKASHAVASYTANLVPRITTPDDATLAATYPRVADVKRIVDAALAQAAVEGQKPVGSLTTDITRARTGSSTDDRGSESTLGNLVANALRDQLADPSVGGAQIGVVNPGGLRADLLFADTKDANGTSTGGGDGVITYAEANAVLPFLNNLGTTTLTGAQFTQALEQQFQPSTSSRPFLNLGLSDNVHYTYDPSKPAGSRITSVTVDGTPLDPAGSYRIGTFSFLLQGGDNFGAFAQGTNTRDSGLVDRDAWISYLSSHQPVAPDFHKLGVVVTNQPTTLTAGRTASFGVSKLDLTSAGSPANVTLTAFLGGRGVGTASVTNGAATVNISVPANLRGPQTVTLVAQPTGTTVTFPVTVTGIANDVVVTPSTVQAGSAITIELVDWSPGRLVSLRFNTTRLPTATVGPDGRALVNFTIPTTTPGGIYEVRANGTSPAVQVSRFVTVTAKTPQVGTITLNRTAVRVGKNVVVTLRGFAVSGDVLLTLEDGTVLDTVTLNAKGNGITTIAFPAVPNGPHQVRVTAPDGSSASATVTSAGYSTN